MKLAGLSIRNLLNGAYIILNSKSTKKFQYKSYEEINSYKKQKLKQILWIAVNHVPFYSSLKKEINFDNFSFEELNKFPIITKSIIRNNYEQFLVQKYKNKKIEYKATSGSSGQPFKVPKAYFSDGIEQCMMFRAWSMNPKYEYSFHDPCIVLRSFSPDPGAPLHKVDPILNYWYLSPFDINDKTIFDYYNIIIKSKAKLIRAYPSSLYILTTLLEKHQLRIPQIKTLFTSSENLLPTYKNKIDSYWNIPLIDWYGQNERTVTVQMCEYGVYHNNDEYGIIELDNNNQIIATSLTNNIMPLIRYATNDIAIPTEKKICKCGRGLSIPFKSIDGRADDLLVKKDGSVVATVNIYNAMEQFQDIGQFRIVQNEDRSVLLELVPLDDFREENIINVEYEILKRLGDIKIETKLIENIERDRITGKIKAIISNANTNI